MIPAIGAQTTCFFGYLFYPGGPPIDRLATSDKMSLHMHFIKMLKHTLVTLYIAAVLSTFCRIALLRIALLIIVLSLPWLFGWPAH